VEVPRVEVPRVEVPRVEVPRVGHHKRSDGTHTHTHTHTHTRSVPEREAGGVVLRGKGFPEFIHNVYDSHKFTIIPEK